MKNENQDLFGGLLDEEKPVSYPGRLSSHAPLADRMRPQNLDELLGQDAIIGPGTLLRKSISQHNIPSMIFWGPPGSGKTSLAFLLAKLVRWEFRTLSAVTAGVKDIREVVQEARHLESMGKRTLLFIDEIHRFNKAQQDALLPHVEKGLLTLIGATTENPSFEVNSALLSRCRVYVLNPLTAEHLKELLIRALADKERGYGKEQIHYDMDSLDYLAKASHGDARSALNALEMAVVSNPERPLELTREMLQEALQRKALLYDKSGEEHYNLISALHKSLRGSDPQAAIYWLARMFAAGEEPLYVARRLVRFASEDVGNADPQALVITISALQSYHALGTPEGELAIAQAALYLATAPKSNACYVALNKATETAMEKGPLPTPLSIRNAPTMLMKGLGYGKDYLYDHDSPYGFRPQQYLPDELVGMEFYKPVERGFERVIQNRLNYLQKLKEKLAEELP